MRRPLPFLAAAVLLAACAPEPGPVDMAVLAPDPVTGAYRLEVVRIETLEDVPALRGAAATPIGGARLLLDPWSLDGVSTEEAFRARVIRDAGGPVEAQFVERDGALWPIDFHSLNLATAYRNFEVARRYALARGLDPAGPLTGVRFYYFPDFRWSSSPDDRPAPLADNAAYFTPLRSFLLLPFDELQEIPLPMNLGVIAHEYGHAIFGAEVHGDSFLPHALRWSASSPGARLLGALEEGLADAWGAAVTGDPRFAARSLPGSIGSSRDLAPFVANRHCYSPATFAADLATADGCADGGDRYWDVRQYRLGTVWAAALWRAGEEPGTDRERVMDAVFAAYRAAGPASLADAVAADATGDAFGDLAVPARALVAGAPDEPTRVALCRVLGERLALTPDGCAGVPPAVDGCGGVTLARSGCP